ncbi:hypothetical protein MSHOH_2099 [Methanosarcina horonobensis HB-1 = JCM 15518]|uniref:Uncharacterized protein n=2 Tax=Methanosarcina horonobensis TaxID=418008 RepID=A0A0E3SEH2_9EURY|nr:hypothetical protein MSHOH_2099 [Methanosarcina horonobensis HB-1 = JCM 15518]
MFQIFLILILFSLASDLAAAEAPAEQWNRSFGGNSEDSAWCVQQTSDGGYIAAGVKNKNAWLVKLAGDEENIECEDREGIEYENTSDSDFSQIKNYIYDIFPVIFQQNRYK